MIYKLFTSLYKHTNKAVIIASLWTALIFVACFIPGSSVPKVQLPLIDKWVHFFIFGGFSFLWYFVLKSPTWTKSICICLLALGLGYAVELVQGSGWVTNRSYELNDVIADGIGGIIGTIMYVILFKIIDHNQKIA